jgi:hypothetical protein
MQTCKRRALKLSRKLAHNVAHVGSELLKNRDDSLKFGTTDPLERHRAMKLGLHDHLRIGRREKIQACIVFQGVWGINGQHQIGIFPVRETNPAVVPDEKTYGNQSMLVGIVEIAKHPQGMFICGSPSMIRLHFIDDSLNVGGRSLYHGHRSGFVFIGSLKDGELRSGRGCLVIGQDQLPNQVVESGPKLICNFTREQDQLDRWISEARIFGKESDYARLEVTLYPYAIRTTLKRSDLLHEPIEVLYGPFNLSPDSI